MKRKERLKDIDEGKLRINEIFRHFLISYHNSSNENVESFIGDFIDEFKSSLAKDFVQYVLS